MTTLAADQAAALRTALLDQLAYLIDEIEALKGVLSLIPIELQTLRLLPGEWSIKESYHLLALRDRVLYLPCLHAMAAGTVPASPQTDEELLTQTTGEDLSLEDILDQIQDGRREVLDFLEQLAPETWTTTSLWGETSYDLYGLVHHICQQDTDLLRSIGQRLHDVHRPRFPGASL